MESDYKPTPSLELLQLVAYEKRLQRIRDDEKYTLIRDFAEKSLTEELAHDLRRHEIEYKDAKERLQLLGDIIFYKQHILKERDDR